MSDDVITNFAIEQDQQSINRTLQTVEKLEAGLDAVGMSASQSADKIQRMSQDIQSVPDVDPFAGGLTPQVTGESVDYGKTTSALTGLGGAISQVGGVAGEAAGQALNFVAAGPDFIDNILNLTDGLSLMGGIAGGIVVAGIAAATFVVSEFNKEAEETAKVVNAAKEAQIAYNEALSLTSDEIENTITANEEQLQINRANQQAVREAIDALGEPSNILFDIGDGLGWVGSEGDKLADELKALEEEEQELTTSTEGLTEALKSQEVAANDARQALLDEVDQLAEVRRFEQDALNSSAEQNAERARQIQNERAIVQEQIATLKASGDTSKEVQDRIEELTNELGTLDEQTAILNSEAVKASEAQKTLAESTGEVADAAKEAGEAQQAVANAESKRFNELSKSLTEIATAEAEAQAEIIAARKEGYSEYLELINQQIEDSAEGERQRQKEINDIAEEGRQSAKRAAESFDFLEAFRKRQETATDVTKAQVAADEKAAIEERGNIKIRQQLLRNIQEEALIRQAEAEAKIQQAANELLQQAVQAQTEIGQLQQTADEKNRILERAGQQEINIASRTAQAQIDIATQSLNVLQQLQQTAMQQVQSIGSQISNITNNSITAFPNVTNLGGQNLSSIEQQMIQMITLAAGG